MGLIHSILQSSTSVFSECYCTTDPQCREGDIRLFSNQSSEEFVMPGQVEICSFPRLGGFRTKVCDTNWDDQDAKVVCRELGLPHGRYTNLTVSIGSQP